MLVTPKQRDFLLDPFARINLLEGSVRSGKTYCSLVRWAMWVRQRPKDELFMMVGKTRETLQFNCVELLSELTGGDFYASQKANTAQLYGHEVRLLGASDEKATSKIKGSTLAGVYIDELTEIPESFYRMCLSRLSRPGAILLATTNPDTPRSYVYTDIIQNDEINRKVWTFLIDDNTFLDPEYVANIKREYTGVFFERYILSKWVLAEGLVYPRYNNTVETVPRDYVEWAVSMDYGTQNPTAMLLWGRVGGTWYAVDEYYHSGRATNEQKTDEEYYAELERLAERVPTAPGERVTLYIDPSAASFIACVRKHHRFKVRPADNSVIDGIRNVQTALTRGVIWFNSVCKNTIEEFGLYRWDDKAVEDTVIKDNDHCLAGDTIVHTLFGRRKIKDLIGKRGWVWSYDEKRKRRVLRRFRDVRQTGSNREMVRITLNNGKTVDCTSDHLILTRRGWVEAGKLNATDYVIDIMDGLRKVKRVQGRAQPNCVGVAKVERIANADVYNMEVEDTHCFAVNGGIIVHNCMDAVRYFVQTANLIRKADRDKRYADVSRLY